MLKNLGFSQRKMRGLIRRTLFQNVRVILAGETDLPKPQLDFSILCVSFPSVENDSSNMDEIGSTQCRHGPTGALFFFKQAQNISLFYIVQQYNV